MAQVQRHKLLEKLSDKDFLTYFQSDMDFKTKVEEQLHLSDKYNIHYKNDIKKFVKQLNTQIKSIHVTSKIDSYSANFFLDEQQHKAYAKISAKYPFQIMIRGDGNSFYRAFLINYLINLMLNKKISVLISFIKRIMSIDQMSFTHKKVKDSQKNVAYLKTFLVAFLVECLIQTLNQDKFNLDTFVNDFNATPIVDFALIVFCKHIILDVYDNLQYDEENKSLYNGSEADKISNYLKSYGQEAEDFIFPLAAYGFQVDLIMQDLYTNENKKLITEELTYHPLPAKEIEEQIVLLNEKSHYDCLITKDLSEAYLTDNDEIKLYENIDQAKKEREEGLGEEEESIIENVLEQLVEEQNEEKEEVELDSSIKTDDYEVVGDMKKKNLNEKKSRKSSNEEQLKKELERQQKEEQERLIREEKERQEAEKKRIKQEEEEEKRQAQLRKEFEIYEKQQKNEQIIKAVEKRKQEIQEKKLYEEAMKLQEEEERKRREEERLQRELEKIKKLEEERLKQEADEREQKLKRELEIREKADLEERRKEEEQRQKAEFEKWRMEEEAEKWRQEEERLKREAEEKKQREEEERIRAEEERIRQEEEERRMRENERKQREQERLQREAELREKKENERKAQEQKRQEEEKLKKLKEQQQKMNRRAEELAAKEQLKQNATEQQTVGERVHFKTEQKPQRKQKEKNKNKNLWIYLGIGAAIVFGTLAIEKVKKTEVVNHAVGVIKSKI